MDQELLRKRMSQIELEIDEMNHVIDENLQLNEEPHEDLETELNNSLANSDERSSRLHSREEFLANYEGKERVTEEGDRAKHTSAQSDSDAVEPLAHPEVQGLHVDNELKDSHETKSSKIAEKDSRHQPEEELTYDQNCAIDPPGDKEASQADAEELPHVAREPSVDTDNVIQELNNKEVKATAPQTHSELSLATEPATLNDQHKTDRSTVDANKSIVDTAKSTDESASFTGGLPILSDHESNHEWESRFDPHSNLQTPEVDSKTESTATSLPLPKTRNTATPIASGARQTSNPSPFRVVSVTSKQSEKSQAQKLNSRHEYLTLKCSKLQREIQYLSDLRDRGAVAPEDSRKINNALVKLQEYLDRKTKERYEIGVLLSRQLRREIDRGENGQFWVGN
ncbi:LADA_0E02784g1_1 [Lachancea dasiensis]|uniref:LADA_0E02784g1_1 n=1 Tax=Lachancea dasiensis TaxID=1072105 RepID=A0A1G4JAW9_9SACH|nr:LADA_0E02784g1_1 [Lachancea dasiensis]